MRVSWSAYELFNRPSYTSFYYLFWSMVSYSTRDTSFKRRQNLELSFSPRRTRTVISVRSKNWPKDGFRQCFKWWPLLWIPGHFCCNLTNEETESLKFPWDDASFEVQFILHIPTESFISILKRFLFRIRQQMINISQSKNSEKIPFDKQLKLSKIWADSLQFRPLCNRF